MLRIILQETDTGAAANLGCSVYQGVKSFDVDLPEVEAWLKTGDRKWNSRQVLGIEIIDKAQES